MWREWCEVRRIEIEQGDDRKEEQRHHVQEQHGDLDARAHLDPENVDDAQPPEQRLREEKAVELAARERRGESFDVTDNSGDDAGVAHHDAEPVRPYGLESGEVSERLTREDVWTAGLG